MEYTKEDLEFAIKQVIVPYRNPEVWRQVNIVQGLHSAIVEVFVEWHNWQNGHEVIDVLRAAEKDLRKDGQFNYSDRQS